MTKLLDEALAAVRRLPAGIQDDIAGVVLRLIGEDELPRVVLTAEERAAISKSKAAATRGEFATDEEVQAVWGKHGA
jgi:predicted transcriptional regulator